MMNKAYGRVKQSSSSSFYNTNYTEHQPFSFKKRLINSNMEIMENMTIETQSKLEKLKEKILLDQERVQRNYQELEIVSNQIEENCKNLLKDKEIENLLRVKKQQIKDIFKDIKSKNISFYLKASQQLGILEENAQQKQRQMLRERQQRESCLSRLIDEFQGELVTLQKQMKTIRINQQQTFQGVQVKIYTLQQQCFDNIEKQTQSRKKQHQTIVRLVSECIENYARIY